MVVDRAELNDDLVRDFTEVFTSFCARLYERRSAANRVSAAMTAAGNSDVDSVSELPRIRFPER